MHALLERFPRSLGAFGDRRKYTLKLSVDQLESNSPSLIAQLKGKLTQQRYKYVMVFVDTI